ncbi:hypothetical protein J4408_01435 [Candidatus Pacearchaeota archaeon]|nr:hypothetical protein [Candidatus Pacearchaeota archaeon]
MKSDTRSLVQINETGLGVDIDETLSWTVGRWAKEMQKLFGNPENLSAKEIVDKYSYTQNVPYWQSEKALKWMEEKRNSTKFQKELPLIENSNHFLNKINEIIPIAAYITIRPELVRAATRDWLQKNGFPMAPIICRPDKVPTKDANKWKAQVIEELYPKIVGFIDDSSSVIESLSKNYKGTIFHYNKTPIKTKLKVVNCKDWETIYEEVRKFFEKKYK